MYMAKIAALQAKKSAKREKKVISRLKPVPRYGKTFIKEWRDYRNLTQEQLAERVGILTYASIGRIERGIQPYTQPTLEALADALQTEPASLLMRDPKESSGIWTVWDQASASQRRQIVEIANTLLKTGTYS